MIVDYLMGILVGDMLLFGILMDRGFVLGCVMV